MTAGSEAAAWSDHTLIVRAGKDGTGIVDLEPPLPPKTRPPIVSRFPFTCLKLEYARTAARSIQERSGWAIRDETRKQRRGG